MEDNEDLKDFSSHIESCRFCLATISESDIFYKLSETAREQFEKLTSLELDVSTELSHLVCVDCHRNLGRFSKFRDDLIKRQEQLNQFVFTQIDDCVQELIEEDEGKEYLKEETISNCFADEAVDFVEESSEIEFMITDSEGCDFSSQSASTSRKISRPKKWEWTAQMEVDLIKLFSRYNNLGMTNNLAFGKISKKFESKGYPRISLKSVKYKYEKLCQDASRMSELKEQADAASASDNEIEVEISREQATSKQKATTAKRTYCSWDQEMEIMLLQLITNIREEQPAISDNTLWRNVTEEMKLRGYSNLTEHIVVYKFKKLKQDEDKFERLSNNVAELNNQEFQRSSKRLDLSSGEDGSKKRNYLYWTEEMKLQLMSHRQSVGKRSSPGELWKIVAKRMKDEFPGYGSFTAQSVMYKYFNLRRDKTNTSTDEVCGKET